MSLFLFYKIMLLLNFIHALNSSEFSYWCGMENAMNVIHRSKSSIEISTHSFPWICECYNFKWSFSYVHLLQKVSWNDDKFTMIMDARLQCELRIKNSSFPSSNKLNCSSTERSTRDSFSSWMRKIEKKALKAISKQIQIHISGNSSCSDLVFFFFICNTISTFHVVVLYKHKIFKFSWLDVSPTCKFFYLLHQKCDSKKTKKKLLCLAGEQDSSDLEHDICTFMSKIFSSTAHNRVKINWLKKCMFTKCE